MDITILLPQIPQWQGLTRIHREVWLTKMASKHCLSQSSWITLPLSLSIFVRVCYGCISERHAYTRGTCSHGCGYTSSIEARALQQDSSSICSSTLSIEAGSVSQAQIFPVWLVSLVNLLWASPVSISRSCVNYRSPRA